MNDNVEIIRSNKGGMKIIHRGYMYTVHKKRQGGGIRWRCTQRSLHCKGSISTGNGPPTVNMPHNHIPDPHSVFLARCRQIEDLPDVNSLLETEYDEAKAFPMESKPKNRKINRYNRDFKQNVVLYAELQRSIKRTVQKYGISASNIRRWRKNKKELFNDAMPLQQRLAQNPSSQAQVQPNPCENRLQSQPLSPTKLKVTRQANKSPVFNQKCSEASSSSAAPEEVCLRWNSHHSNMQTSFPNLLEKEQYVDVTIIAEGQTIKCHKMILSSCSTYFEEILNGITPLQHPVIILNNTPFWIIKTLINFMYIGEVNIDQNKLPDLLDIAELLKVKGLAGKGSNSRNPESDKKETIKKLTVKETNGRQSMIIRKIPQISPTIPKLEEIPINDPLDLLEPKFQEEENSRIKDKLQAKKILVKKFRKRKSSENEAVSSPPLFPMRRGTRSRPNVKVPRYYDYEDIVKPTSTQVSEIQPFSPIVNIKTEPIDEEEQDDISKSLDDDPDFPKLINNDVDPIKINDANQQFYKIKIKSLSSLSEKIPDEKSDCDVNDTSCSIEVIQTKDVKDVEESEKNVGEDDNIDNHKVDIEN